MGKEKVLAEGDNCPRCHAAKAIYVTDSAVNTRFSCGVCSLQVTVDKETPAPPAAGPGPTTPAGSAGKTVAPPPAAKADPS